jgi:hypothetical protein
MWVGLSAWGACCGEGVSLCWYQEVESACILQQWKKGDAGGDLANDGLDFAHDILFTLVELLVGIMDALFVCLYVKIPSFKNLGVNQLSIQETEHSRKEGNRIILAGFRGL